MNPQNLLTLFHHIHHKDGQHEVHHCGGEHVKIDPSVNYSISHCQCGKHAIDVQSAIGHALDILLDSPAVSVIFHETCPHGGWHIESGAIDK